MIKLISRALIVVVVSLVLQACGKLAPELSCNMARNSQKQRVAWTDARLPVKLYIHNSVPRKHHEDLKKAVEFWNNKSNQELFEIVSFFTDGNSSPKRDGYNMISWKDTWESENSTEQARTQLNWSKTSLYEADIVVNDHNFDYATFDEELKGKIVDFTSLMIHELGHVLGLAHNEDQSSVMNTKLAYGEDRQETENIVDVKSLSCEYDMKDI